MKSIRGSLVRDKTGRASKADENKKGQFSTTKQLNIPQSEGAVHRSLVLMLTL